jgi:CRISPR system Cascade subunit CasD
MEVLVLDLRAPLMSFGGPVVDERGTTARFPALSMVTGLLANALGWDHADRAALQALQDGLWIASRVDRSGTPLMDYQTAELSKDDKAWTTWGKPQTRGGGASTYEGPVQRWMHYWADAAVTTVLAVREDRPPPVSLATLMAALDRPARPLVLGRKACLPAGPLGRALAEAADPFQALRLGLGGDGDRKPGKRTGGTGVILGQWPAEWAPDDRRPATGRSVEREVNDLRNWRASTHMGARLVGEGDIADLEPLPLPPRPGHAGGRALA